MTIGISNTGHAGRFNFYQDQGGVIPAEGAIGFRGGVGMV
jgi:hypothetical protein